MRTTRLRALLFALVGTAGCTTSGGEDAGLDLERGSAPLSRAGSLSLVRVERALPLDATASGRVVANAKVARYAGLDASTVLKLLGADTREGDSCASAGRLDDFPMAPEARVELLSVGPIALRAGELVQVLTPRLFPDLATTASGWFYAAEAELPSERFDEYVLSAQGQQGVGRFEVSVGAPGEVLGLELAGHSLDLQGALTRSVDAELTWEPEDMRDRLELEIYAGGSALSCSVRDDGHFVLPQAKLANLEQDPQASLVLRRVRVLSTDMQGIETAYVRVATARTLPLRVD